MTKQQNLSRLLIPGVIVMSYVFYLCTHGENEKLILSVLLCPLITVMLGGYVFTYKGKDRIIGNILFLIFFVLSALGIYGYLFAVGLGKWQ